MKHKGRKIYRTKDKNYYGKTPAGKAVSVGLTILLIGGIGVLGYSIAEPIVNYTKRKGDSDVSVTTTTETPSDVQTTAAISQSITGSFIDTGSNSFTEYRAFALTEADMADFDSLKYALDRIPSAHNFEYVEIPLKVSGGSIYYNSGVFYASQSGAVRSLVTLDDIVSAVRSKGYKPTALISTFRDSILPRTNRDSGYITAATDEQWIDNDVEAGGKPWTSPYSDIALKYISDIIGEAADAGFERIICTDMVFPQFRQTDLELLDPVLSEKERYLALTSAANVFHERALMSGGSMALEVSASDILKGSDDIIKQPEVLNVKSIILNINIDEISSGVYTDDTVYEFSGTSAEKVTKMLELVSGKLSGFSNVAVRISGSSAGTDELLKACEVIGEFGYSSYVIG